MAPLREKNSKAAPGSDRVGASLPPRIEGATRGELEIRVGELRGAEGLTLVLRWWGEGAVEGVAFDVTRKNQKKGRAGCLFPSRVDGAGLGRYLKDARVLRFDVVAHGRVVGALKVPLNRAPIGSIEDEGEKSLVDARFSAAQIQETGLTPAQLARRPPRKQLGSVRVKVVARMGAASKVKAAVLNTGALKQSVDGPLPSSEPSPALIAGRLASAGNRFYRDPEALGEAIPVGKAGQRTKVVETDVYNVRESEENPWGAAEHQTPAYDRLGEHWTGGAADAPASVFAGPPAPTPPAFGGPASTPASAFGGPASVSASPAFAPDGELTTIDERTTLPTQRHDVGHASPSALEVLLRRGEALREHVVQVEHAAGLKDDGAAVAAFLDEELIQATESSEPPPPPPSSIIGKADDPAPDEPGGVPPAPALHGGGVTAPLQHSYVASAPLDALERRAQALAADVDDDAAEFLAHEDDALVDELLRDPEIRAAIAPAPAPVVEAPPQQQHVVEEAFTTPAAVPPLPSRQLRCLLRVRSGVLNRETAAASSAARVAHHWALPNKVDRARKRRDGKFGSDYVAGERHNQSSSYEFAYDCGAPYSTGDALSTMQVVEVWARSYDGVSDALVGVAKVSLEALRGKVGAETRRVIKAHRLNNVDAVSRVDDWLVDAPRALVADCALHIVDPRSARTKGMLHVTLAVGTPQQLRHLDDARTYDACQKLQAAHRGHVIRRAHRFDDGATQPLSRAVEEEFFPVEEEALASSVPAVGVVQHTLEISLAGECALPGADSGATVSYRLSNEDGSLWWDGDSSRLNSRLRHDFSTPLTAVDVAAVRALVGDGSSGVRFRVQVDGGDAYEGSLPIRDVKALVRQDVRDFTCTLPLARRGVATPFTLPLTFEYRREPDAVSRVRASRETITLTEEEEPTVILRARHFRAEAPAAVAEAHFQAEAPPPPLDEPLNVTVSGARGLGAVLRAWRTQGRGSGTFPLENPEANVVYSADLEVRVLGASEDVLATLTSPSFSFSGSDEENDVLDSTVLLPERSLLIEGACSLQFAIRLVDVRAGAASAAVDGPLGVPIAAGSAQLPIDGWVRISGSAGTNHRGALRVRAGAGPVALHPASPVVSVPPPTVAPPRPPTMADAATSLDADRLTAMMRQALQPAVLPSTAPQVFTDETTSVRVTVERCSGLTAHRDDWRWTVAWKVDGVDFATPPVSGASAVDFCRWSAVAKIPTRRLSTASIVFEVLGGETNRPTASRIGATTVDLGMLACGLSCVDGAYRLTDDFCREKGVLHVAIGVVAEEVSEEELPPPTLCEEPVAQTISRPADPRPESPDAFARQREKQRGEALSRRAHALEAAVGEEARRLSDLGSMLRSLEGLGARLLTIGQPEEADPFDSVSSSSSDDDDDAEGIEVEALPALSTPGFQSPPPWERRDEGAEEEEETWSDAPPSSPEQADHERANALAESLRKQYDADAAALAEERAAASEEMRRAQAEREALAAELRKASEERRRLEERTSMLEQREAQQRINAECAAQERAEASAALAARAAAETAARAAAAVEPARVAALDDDVAHAAAELRAARVDLAAHAPAAPSDSGASSTSSGRRYRDPRFAAEETERIARIMRGALSA